MKYTNKNRELLKQGMKVWACAYKFDNNKTTMGLIQKPIYGVIRGYGYDWGGNAEEGYPAFFAPLSKNSETKIVKSKVVSIHAREYADTYEECVELYNDLVKGRIDWFKQRAEETEKDLIEK